MTKSSKVTSLNTKVFVYNSLDRIGSLKINMTEFNKVLIEME